MLRVKLSKKSHHDSSKSMKNINSYRKYANEALSKAYDAVTKSSMSIRKAASVFAVPRSTLFDRVKGHVDKDCKKSGPDPLLSENEERSLVEHIANMASYGYGYTRREVVAIATDLAIHVGKKKLNEPPFSIYWFYQFMKRWPELKVQKARSLEIYRAKATSEENISHYYERLGEIMTRHNLTNSPERIYNVDEKGLMEYHTPPLLVGSTNENLVSVTCPRSSTTTVIGCGNAIGQAIPPFLVFKGKRMNSDLLQDGLPGTAGTVSDSGWSNSEIFQRFLSDHFIKYAVSATPDKPLLISYDGHRSHVNIPLINWARERNIVLFVLPAHTSHVLKPMDVGCFGPFQKIYDNQRHKCMREHATSSVSRHAICSLGCKAYSAALSAVNLQSSFKKCGIYPFDASAIDHCIFGPSKVFIQNVEDPRVVDISSTESFLKEIDSRTFHKNQEPKKKRNVLSAIVGGKAITEDSVMRDIIKHQEVHQPAKKKVKKTSKTAPVEECIPSTSGLAPDRSTTEVNTDSDSDAYADDDEVCCQCNLFQPAELRNCTSVIFVSWAQCTYPSCNHWTHLKFCTPVRVVRSSAEFWCPCHCEKEE